MNDKDPQRYDTAAWEIFRRFEAYLDDILQIGIMPLSPEECGHVGCDFKKAMKIKTFGQKIRLLEFRHRIDKPEIVRSTTSDALKDINNMRKKFAHIDDSQREEMKKSLYPVIVIKKLATFVKFKGCCIKASRELYNAFGKRTEMADVMIQALRYQMGNAGDIIKHGLLAEFAEWWLNNHNELAFFDSFAGCPWSAYNDEMAARIDALGCVALRYVYSEQPRKYFGSSYLMHKIADNMRKGEGVRIFVNDKNADARSNFAQSDMPVGMSLARLPGDDGYAILKNEIFQKHSSDLVLIDPYSKFLLEECASGNQRFNAISSLTEANPRLFVAVFVLDMKNNHVHHQFVQYRKTMLAENKAISLRCPKMDDENFASEILLISNQLQNGQKTADLRKRLRKFVSAAEHALKLDTMARLETGEEFDQARIMHWGLGDA